MKSKRFDDWNILKKQLDSQNTGDIFFYEKEIWFCSIGINIGSEQDSRNKKFSRPILIFKKCNSHTFIGIPLTTKPPRFPDRITIHINNMKCTAIISQIRLFDRNRLLRKHGIISKEDWGQIKTNLSSYLDL